MGSSRLSLYEHIRKIKNAKLLTYRYHYKAMHESIILYYDPSCCTLGVPHMHPRRVFSGPNDLDVVSDIAMHLLGSLSQPKDTSKSKSHPNLCMLKLRM